MSIAVAHRHPDLLSQPPSSLRRFGRATAITTLLAAAFLLVGCEKKEEAPKPGPPEVSVVAPQQQDVPIYAEYVAQLNGPVNAEITPKVQGYLLRQDLPERLLREEGRAAVRTRPPPVPGALDQSKADVAVAEANLVSGAG